MRHAGSCPDMDILRSAGFPTFLVKTHLPESLLVVYSCAPVRAFCCLAATGILRSSEFSTLEWDETSRRGCMADILRVHEWSYVRSLQHMCASIPDIPAVIGHLDGDTAISNGTFRAALAAVGGICNAVDRVVKGEVQQPFLLTLHCCFA
jgi:hypothetical protein